MTVLTIFVSDNIYVKEKTKLKTLVIYDSQYGNTKKVAEAIAKPLNNAKLVNVNAATTSDLDGIELLIVGSPTQGGRATQAVQDFINAIPSKSLDCVKICAFDTRFKTEDQRFFIRFLMKTIDFAAPKIDKSLKTKGGKGVVKPQGFYVSDKKGPLNQGELDRAFNWLKNVG